MKQSQATIPDNLEGIAREMFKNIVGETVTGYEIHEGTTNLLNCDALLNIKKGQGNDENGLVDGACHENIFATYSMVYLTIIISDANF